MNLEENMKNNQIDLERAIQLAMGIPKAKYKKTEQSKDRSRKTGKDVDLCSITKWQSTYERINVLFEEERHTTRSKSDPELCAFEESHCYDYTAVSYRLEIRLGSKEIPLLFGANQDKWDKKTKGYDKLDELSDYLRSK